MAEPLPKTTLAWLRQTAKFEGAVTAQVLLHLLERLEGLERPEVAQQQPADHVPGVTKMVPTPEAALVATDKELRSVYGSVDGAGQWGTHGPALRACYDLGRQHGAAAAQPAPPAAPAGLLGRVMLAIDGSNDLEIEARAAIREVAAWMDECGRHGCSLWLREEVD